MNSTPHTSQTQEAPTASELLVMAESGQTAEMQARIQNLSQRDFISIQKAIAAVEQALDTYALSWKGAEYWCYGGTFPDEAQAKAASA